MDESATKKTSFTFMIPVSKKNLAVMGQFAES